MLTTETWSGAAVGPVARNFDNDFAPSTATVTGSSLSQAIAYGYDLDKLVTCASPTTCGTTPPVGALTIARSPLNGTIQTMTQDSVTESYTYNDFGELATKTAKFGTTVLHKFEYDVKAAGRARDSLGRIVKRTETIGTTAASTTEYWSNAYKKCAELITSKQTSEVKRLRGSRSGQPYGLDDCARGFVSAACGGNLI